MKSFLRLVIFLAVISFVFPLKSYADTSCQPIYGGGQTCVTTGNISINKTVLNPQTNNMVDSLSINDPKYQPGFLTTFQIALTNTGSNTISRINVQDVFPQYINFSAGPGNFDNNTKTLSFEVDNLASNEQRTFTILGRVVDASQIPNDQGVVCVINQATATNIDNTSQVSQDNSQLCIEKKVLAAQASGFPIFPTAKIKVTPPTGPNNIILLSLVPIGIVGYLLRKKSIKNRATFDVVEGSER